MSNNQNRKASSPSYPRTIEDWGIYIASLEGAALLSKALAANSLGFVRMLQEEGADADVIDGVFRLFAEQFVAVGQAIPVFQPGQYVDYLSYIEPFAKKDR